MEKQKFQRLKLLAPIALVATVLVALIFVVPTLASSRGSRYDYEVPAGDVVDFGDLDPENPNNEIAYLTDKDYMAESQTNQGAILKNVTASSAKITLRVDGKDKAFDKGIWAHAESNIYYDLREYQGKFDYLLMYVGLNKTANSTGNVKFSVYTSANETINPNDASVWTVLPEMDAVVKTSAMDATYLKIDIRNVNYIRFYANPNGSKSNDHAVYGDLKLIKASYEQSENLVPTVEMLDAAIRDNYSGQDVETLESNEAYQLAVLRRSLVERAGRQTILSFLRSSKENREAFSWLYNDYSALKYYIHGGGVSHVIGSYTNSLNALSELYQYAVKENNDLADSTPLTYLPSRTRGDLYERMMITIALTQGEHIRLWVKDRVETESGMATGESPDSKNISRPVDRYKVFKRMYLAGKLSTQIFEQLEIEEMRFVMESLIGDDELEWLHDWLTYKKQGPYSYPSMPYRSAGYWHLEDFAEENQAQLTIDKRLDGYALGVGEYTITNDKYQPHLWMILKWGGVCWQISNVGQNMASAFGVPSMTVGQRPDHVAHAVYKIDANNNGYWSLINNVYGWTKTDYISYDGLYSYRYSWAPRRGMNNWGYMYDSRGYAYRYNGTYLLLAQAAMNDYDNYVKAHELVLLADSYAGDLEKQEEIYEKAIEAQNFNLDAWLGLIDVYKAKYARTADVDRGVADQKYLELTERIARAFRTYSVPLYDLTRLFASEISDKGVQASAVVMQVQALQDATKLTAADNIQASVQVTMAKHLLGVVDSEVATFSFDGENANKIVLNEKYQGAAWDYSLDGGVTWSSTDANGAHTNWIETSSYELTREEIESITAANNIKIHFSGVANWSNNYTIDIAEQTMPTDLYANDWENRLVGATDKMEWREKDVENQEWISYRNESPIRAEDKDITVEVRLARTGTKLASVPVEYTFHKDTDTVERKYLPVAHISLHSFSTQDTSRGVAANMIDANINTRWHSAGGDTGKYISFELDHPVVLTGLDYLPPYDSTANGRIKKVLIQGSNDGENWTDIHRETWADNGEWKTTSEFSSGETIKYVRIVGEETRGSYIAGWMFNFYEDSTQSGHPSAAIGYSTTEPTTGNVIARFIKANEDVVIVNNDGSDTYEFTENGSFVFQYKMHNDDGDDKIAQAIAVVDWIDREAPTGVIWYYCQYGEEKQPCTAENGRVNHAVEARLVVTGKDKDGYTILNNGNNDIKNNTSLKSDEDTEAGDDDQATSSEGTIPDGVNNPVSDPTVFTFLRNGTFTFRVRDRAGNIGEIPATVDWIDTTAPKVKIVYSENTKTEKPVVAKVVKVMDSEVGLSDIVVPDLGQVTTDDFKPLNVAKLDRDGLEYNEDFVVINNDGSPEYTFDKNGEFIFEYRDTAGNRASVVARVDWIQEKQSEGTENPGDDNSNKPDDKPTGSGNSGSDNKPNNPGDGAGDNQNSNNQPNDTSSSGEPQPDNSWNLGQNANPGMVNLGGEQIANNDVGQTGSSAGDMGVISGGSMVVETIGLPEGAKAESKQLTLSGELRNKFGANSELFEISFVDADGNVIAERPERMKVAISTTKKLDGVYRVLDDNTTETVEYERIDDSSIMLKNPVPGKYLFDHEERQPSRDDLPDSALIGPTQDEAKTPWYQNPVLYVGLGAVVILGVAGVAAKLIMNRKQ